MGRTACTESQCLHKGATFYLSSNNMPTHTDVPLVNRKLTHFETGFCSLSVDHVPEN